MSTACNFSSFATHDHQHWFIYYLAMFLLDQKLEVEKQPERDWGIIMGRACRIQVFFWIDGSFSTGLFSLFWFLAGQVYSIPILDFSFDFVLWDMYTAFVCQG